MTRLGTLVRGVVALCAVALVTFAQDLPASAADAQSSALPAALLADVNQQRQANGLAPLQDDPRLDAIAMARAQYMLSQGIFSHCVGNEPDAACSQTGFDFPGRAANAGYNLQAPGTAWGENIALNNHNGDIAGQTVQDWMSSAEHRANILNSSYTKTGLAVVCCFSGVVGGQNIIPAYNVRVFVDDFVGGPGATPTTASAPSAGTNSSAQPSCQFVLGFATLAAHLGPVVGQCVDNESHNPANGDALQHTSTNGLLVWRKADNWTAFTDGYHTWINGPTGIAERLNNQRFSWEANPSGLQVVH